MTSGDLQQVYDDASEAAMSDPSLDNHVAGLRAVERAARAAEREAMHKARGTLLFNPYSGKPRHPSDIESDPHGILLVDPERPSDGYSIEVRA